MKPSDFYVATRASKGAKVDLVDPSGNREWMRVRSVLSAEFKAAAREAILRSAMEGKVINGDPKERKRQIRQRRAELSAALVADWSLPFHGQDMAALLIKNPRLRRSIEKIAADHSLHFGVAE